jgi:hypothetical protein
MTLSTVGVSMPKLRKSLALLKTEPEPIATGCRIRFGSLLVFAVGTFWNDF